MESIPKQQKTGFLPYIRRRAFRGELLTLFSAALMGRIVLAGNVMPFGVGYLAAVAMAGLNPHYAFAGAALSALLFSGPLRLSALCSLALFYAIWLVWKRFRAKCEAHEYLFLLFAAQTALLPIFYAESWQLVLQGLVSMGVSVLSALVLGNALVTVQNLENRQVLTDLEQISISAFFGVLLLSMTDAAAYGFSLPVVLLLLFSMVAALARGIAGVAVSVAIAAVLTIGGEFTLNFVGSLAACTLAGAALRKMDAVGVAGGFFACSLLVGTYVFNAPHTINLFNLALAAVVFLVVPRERMLAVCGWLDADKNRERYAKKATARIRARTAGEMRQTARVCRELSKLFHPEEIEPEPSDALKQWTAQAAYGVCADCPLRVLCWRDYAPAADTVYATLQAHERGERIRIRKPFDPSCKHFTQMAAAAWQAQNQYLVQHALKTQTGAQYGFIEQELAGISEVLDALARRVAEDTWIDEELEHQIVKRLDKAGIRIFGCDAAYPESKLQLHVRVSAGYLTNAAPVLEALSGVLRRPLRLLGTHTDAKQCILVIEEAEKLSAEQGAAAAAIAQSDVCGDTTGERRLPRGKVLFALSDGMGAGETARLESESAIRMLFDLYSIGLARDAALAGVNKLLLERKADMYATLDAVYVDLASGKAEFIKYGAPPTFIYRGSKLHTVCAEALPAGILPDAVPAVSTATLRPNDTVILFSDGALDALGGQTQAAIVDALQTTRTSREAAARLLERARAQGQEDDMTVMVIKIA